jgi:hypothetical protein
MNATTTMEMTEIFSKTELGVREVKERRLNLPVQLRSVLIMIDGQRTVADVLDKTRMLGIDARAIEKLAVDGLIAPKFAPRAEAANEAIEPQRTEDEVERYLRAQQMMSDAINQHLGLRGYGMMMRLQKAACLRDLHELLRDLAAALVKRVGVEDATPIISEIEGLIVVRQ